jgi:hypothetical protein
MKQDETINSTLYGRKIFLPYMREMTMVHGFTMVAPCFLACQSMQFSKTQGNLAKQPSSNLEAPNQWVKHAQLKRFVHVDADT